MARFCGFSHELLEKTSRTAVDRKQPRVLAGASTPEHAATSAAYDAASESYIVLLKLACLACCITEALAFTALLVATSRAVRADLVGIKVGARVLVAGHIVTEGLDTAKINPSFQTQGIPNVFAQGIVVAITRLLNGAKHVCINTTAMYYLVSLLLFVIAWWGRCNQGG